MPRWFSWWFRRSQRRSPEQLAADAEYQRIVHEWFTLGRFRGSDLPVGGSEKPTAYTDTKPSTGTSGVTIRHAAECSFSIRRGEAWVEEAIPPTLALVSSYGALTSSGPGTAVRGVSGAPPESVA